VVVAVVGRIVRLQAVAAVAVVLADCCIIRAIPFRLELLDCQLVLVVLVVLPV